MKMPLLEICVNDIASAMAAGQGGADRIELCANLGAGGTTPSPGTILTAKKLLRIPVFVLIRPRGGNFTYSEAEIETMRKNIAFCKTAGVDGFVFGVLNEENEIDEARNRELLQLASPLPCTFHRAFDLCPDPLQSLRTLHTLGFVRLLSSGCAANAIGGANVLAQLVQADLLSVMPGGGVREENVAALLRETKAKEVHTSLLGKNSFTLDAARVRKFKTLLEKTGKTAGA